MTDECGRCEELEQRLDGLESLVEAVMDDLQDIDDAVDATDATVESLAQRLDAIESRQAAEQSDKEQRTDELHEALVRKARKYGARAWSKNDVEEELDTLGYDDLTKPVYYDHMDALTEFPAFEETTKSETRSYGDGERTETVTAVGVDPDELPPEPVSNRVTTGEAGEQDDNHPISGDD